MNKAEDCASILLAEEAVDLRKPAAELSQLPDEGFAILVLMVQVDLDVSNAKPDDFRDAVEELAPVLFLRVEKAILRLPPR